MNDGATTEVIESQPMAKAKDPRSRDANARRHAGRKGPVQEEKGTPNLHAVRHTAEHDRGDAGRKREEREQEPEGERIRVRRNEPSGVATESKPSTPPCPANARAVREPIRRKSMT